MVLFINNEVVFDFFLILVTRVEVDCDYTTGVHYTYNLFFVENSGKVKDLVNF
jgi:hypothetical protein